MKIKAESDSAGAMFGIQITLCNIFKSNINGGNDMHGLDICCQPQTGSADMRHQVVPVRRSFTACNRMRASLCGTPHRLASRYFAGRLARNPAIRFAR